MSEIKYKSNELWWNIETKSGKKASISIDALAEKHGPIVGSAIKEWAQEKLNKQQKEADCE